MTCRDLSNVRNLQIQNCRSHNPKPSRPLLPLFYSNFVAQLRPPILALTGASVPKAAADGGGGAVCVVVAAVGEAVVAVAAGGVFRWPR